jgi:hypothetical protein
MEVSRLCYVYGVVPSSFDVAGAPEGVEDGAVTLVGDGDLAALVTAVDAEAYDAPRLEAATADVAWLGARAAAHDRVLTWASDRGAVVPLPIFSLFVDPSRVAAMLAERAETLRDALGRVGAGREYLLRVYRHDDRLVEHLGALSPRVAALEREAAAASPGQRYLLTKKLDAERKLELRRVALDVARAVHAAAAAAALASAVDPVAARADAAPAAAGTLVLQAAYLVAPASLDAFRRAITDAESTYGAHGFRLEFTGPWPAYHFARPTDDARAEPVPG